MKQRIPMALLTLGASWVIAFALALAAPQVVPPGNVWTWSHSVAVAVLLLGTFVAAGFWRVRLIYFLWGCLGATAVLSVLLPDSRDYIAIGWGMDSLDKYFARIAVFIPLMGLVCCGAAILRRIIDANFSRKRATGQCENCGYPLYGLPEKRCPECGTTFTEAIPPPPDATDSK